MFCLIIVVIFIGLGRAHKLGGGRTLKLSNGGGEQATKDETILMGKVDPSRHHIKILIWQL